MINKHSTHIEEFIFTDHKQGLYNAVQGLRYIIDNIGNDLSKSISVKIDGAPAVLWGWGKNGFFVASKSIFNKQSKINYSIDQIYENHSGELADKLAVCFHYLRKITKVTDKVYQGDLLFTDDLKYINRSGVRLILFHPNTIAYTVECDSEVGKQISASKIGIAVHTEYKWDRVDPSTLKVSRFGVSSKQFKSSKDVFLIDTISQFANKNVGGFDKETYNDLHHRLDVAVKLANKFDWTLFDQQGVIATSLMTFVNRYIRENVTMPHPKIRYHQYKRWVDERIEQAIESKKTERGKQNVINKLQCMINIGDYKQQIIILFQIFDLLSSVKSVIINQLNMLSTYQNFVIKTNGDFESTGEEGFVITATSAKGAKLVDRYTFSRNNFSKQIIKGFQHN